MNLKNKILLKLGAIDKLNEDIAAIENAKKELHKDIKAIKEEVYLLNYNLIGREADLIKEDDSESEGICTHIKVEDNLDITPLFSYGSKKIKNVKSYKFK